MDRLQQLHTLYERGELFDEGLTYNKWIFDRNPPIGVEVFVWPTCVDHFGLKGVYYGGKGYGSWGIDGIQEASEEDVKAWRINK